MTTVFLTTGSADNGPEPASSGVPAGQPPMASSPRPQHACSFCKRQKRKCDKLTPQCTTCKRLRRECEYALDNREDELERLRARLQDLERMVQGQAVASIRSPQETPSNQTRNVSEGIGDWSSLLPQFSPRATPHSFPSAFFLDVPMFQRMNMQLPQPSEPAPDYLLLELGSSDSIRYIVDSHFATTHKWLPIIWRRKIYKQISHQGAHIQHGMALLLTSMKLAGEMPNLGHHPSQSRLYGIVKREISLLESQGYVSVGLLQAAVLVASYELGHGIYPAAYLSVGHCVNLAYMLGLHDRRSAPHTISKPGSWGEPEELTRIWCAILVLDRYIHLGSQNRPLTSGDFTDDEILPCDTPSWDRGEPSASIPLFVTSATRIRADPFARICQVAHLLGRVFSHRDDKSLTGEYRFTSARQMLATLDSLIGLLATEVESDPMAFGSAYAMALSGKMIFLDIYSCTDTNGRVNCTEETELQVISLRTYPEAMHEARRLALRLLALFETDIRLLDTLSPFVADCFYQGAQAAAWYLDESGDEQMKEVLDNCVQALARVGERWTVAGEYTKIVEKAGGSW